MGSLRIVLVQPRNPLNILAAARAARNFGLGDIVIAEVHPPAWAEALEKDVDRETPHGPRGSGRGWLGDARKFDTLMEAIGDCDWVLGTSSLDRRRAHSAEVIDLRDLADLIRDANTGVSLSPTADTPRGSPSSPPATHNAAFTRVSRRRIAILFGSEKRGLTNDHLMHCHHLLRIPTVDALPSMNLGQAVAVVCYELARSGVLEARKEGQSDTLTTGATGAAGQFSAELSKMADFAGSSAKANFTGIKETSNSAADSKSPGKLGAGKISAEAESSGDSSNANLSELKENNKELRPAANTAQLQALVQQINALIKGKSASSGEIVEEANVDTRHRNLYKVLNKLPLTSDDVRLLLGVVKDARSAISAPAARPKKPRPPRNP